MATTLIRGRILYATLAMLLVLTIVPTPSAWSQAPSLDPQSLVGEWSGSWTTAGAVQSTRSGRYYLTIEKVVGDKVHGTGRVEGRGGRDFNFLGTLAGDHLKFGEANVADLVVSGNQMRGKIQGRVNWDVDLLKAK
jgi:hypothetical protein